MKTTKLQKQRLTKGEDFIRKTSKSLLSRFCCGFVGFSHSEHDFDLSSFNDDIRKNQFTNMSKSFSVSYPSKNSHSRVFGCLFSSIMNDVSSKCFVNPLNESFVSVVYLKGCLIMKNARFLIGRVISNSKASFSVNNSSQISKFCNRIGFSYVSFAKHIHSFVKGVYTLHETRLNVQPQRLNPEAP